MPKLGARGKVMPEAVRADLAFHTRVARELLNGPKILRAIPRPASEPKLRLTFSRYANQQCHSISSGWLFQDGSGTAKLLAQSGCSPEFGNRALNTG